MNYPIQFQERSQVQQALGSYQLHDHHAHQPHHNGPYGDSLHGAHDTFTSSCSSPVLFTPAFPPHLVNEYRHRPPYFSVLQQTTDLNDQYDSFSRGSPLSYLHHQDTRYLTVDDRGFTSSRFSPVSYHGASLDVINGTSAIQDTTLGYSMYQPEDIAEYRPWLTTSGSTPTTSGYNDTTHGRVMHETVTEMSTSSTTVGNLGVGLGVDEQVAGRHNEMSMTTNSLNFVSTATTLSATTAIHGQHSLNTPNEQDPYPRHTPILRSPAAQLPTPVALAILLNHDPTHMPTLSQPYPPHSVRNPVSGGILVAPGVVAVNSIPTPSTQPSTIIPVSNRMSRSVNGVNGSVIPGSQTRAGEHGSQSREKKHACTMCHKRFDRPSTLRKHLLVHTGEKAFVCDTCGRRFGVASNLNRHVRRCISKVGNAGAKSLSGSPPASAASSSAISSSSEPTYSQHGKGPGHTRGIKRSHSLSLGSSDFGGGPNACDSDTKLSIKAEHAASTIMNNSNTTAATNGGVGAGPEMASAAVQNVASPSAPSSTKPNKPATKRRRRAPSPSQWVPKSLLNFNLASEDYFKTTSIPLPPVRRNLPNEERDSWDESFTLTPYHPNGWKDVLPGPGLGLGISGGREARNMNLGGSGTYMYGRVLVC